MRTGTLSDAAGRTGARVVLYVTEVKMCGGTGNEHIAAVRWETPGARVIGESPLSVIVAFIRSQHGEVRVRDRLGNWLRVGVVDADPPHIRAFTDHAWTDHLLALPRYDNP